ncbi:MAG: hypothetical protein IOD12_11025 [Silvanigrellales bacterium]|nr:hypothetical protein [Silvanigrellales bacterium]
MPERIHAALKDSAYARSTMHKPTSDWLKSDYEPPFDPPLVPSSIMLTSRKVGTKGIPYIVVAREKLENAKGVEKRPFAPGSWTPKRLHPATQKAIYCLACHDNVGSPKTPQMAFMFGASGRSVLPKGAGNNWHDLMFGTHLDQRKIDEFFSMSQAEIEDAWRPHVEE